MNHLWFFEIFHLRIDQLCKRVEYLNVVEFPHHEFLQSIIVWIILGRGLYFSKFFFRRFVFYFDN